MINPIEEAAEIAASLADLRLRRDRGEQVPAIFEYDWPEASVQIAIRFARVAESDGYAGSGLWLETAARLRCAAEIGGAR